MSLISTDPFYSPPLDAPPIDFPSLTFEVLHQDELCARVHVDFNTRNVQLEQYTDDFIKRPFYQEHISVEDVLNFFEDRCFPRTRANADQLLADLGLSIYDPTAIVKRTHGLLHEECRQVTGLDMCPDFLFVWGIRVTAITDSHAWGKI